MGETSEGPQDKSSNLNLENTDTTTERGATFTRILVCKNLNLGGDSKVFNEQHRGLEESSETGKVDIPNDGFQITEG